MEKRIIAVRELDKAVGIVSPKLGEAAEPSAEARELMGALDVEISKTEQENDHQLAETDARKEQIGKLERQRFYSTNALADVRDQLAHVAEEE